MESVLSRRGWGGVVGVAVIASMTSGMGLSPAWALGAQARQSSSVSSVVDLGGDISATIDVRTGALRVEFGGVLGMVWDSSAAAALSVRLV